MSRVKRASCGHLSPPESLGRRCGVCFPGEAVVTGDESLDRAVRIADALKQYPGVEIEIEYGDAEQAEIEAAGEEETKTEHVVPSTDAVELEVSGEPAIAPGSVRLTIRCCHKNVDMQLDDEGAAKLESALDKYSDVLELLAKNGRSVVMFLTSERYRAKYWDPVSGLRRKTVSSWRANPYARKILATSITSVLGAIVAALIATI